MRTDGHAWKCINVIAVFFRGVTVHADGVGNLDLELEYAKAGLPPSFRLNNAFRTVQSNV